MRRLPVVIAVAGIVFLAVSSCGKDKPTTPPGPPTYIVTLDYRGYCPSPDNYFSCFRLKLNNNAIERCLLGTRSQPGFVGGMYEYRVYAVAGSGSDESLYFLARDSVNVDRNMTFVISGPYGWWQ